MADDNDKALAEARTNVLNVAQKLETFLKAKHFFMLQENSGRPNPRELSDAKRIINDIKNINDKDPAKMARAIKLNAETLKIIIARQDKENAPGKSGKPGANPNIVIDHDKLEQERINLHLIEDVAKGDEKSKKIEWQTLLDEKIAPKTPNPQHALQNDIGVAENTLKAQIKPKVPEVKKKKN